MKVYKLKHNVFRLIDNENDAIHIPFKDDSLIGANMLSIREFEVPEIIYFQANLGVISKIDYPITDLNIQIMSNKMIKTLLNIKKVNIREISIKMVDDMYFDPLFIDNILSLNVAVINDFKAIQLMNFTKCFDYINSIYEEDFLLPVGHISKMVLKQPKDGFPPIFKIEESSSNIFVSQEGKDALERENLNGCLFENVGDFK